MRLSSLLARLRGDIDHRVAAVMFTVPESRLAEMDVARGPCVALPGRKRPLVHPLSQQLGVTPRHTAALLTVLTGEPSDEAMEVVERRRTGVLHLCGEQFVEAMVDANAELIRLADEDETAGQRKKLPRFTARLGEYDSAWRAASQWPPKARATTNELASMAWARVARERSQPLYVWHGRSVPMAGLASGDGPHPGRAT